VFDINENLLINKLWQARRYFNL